MAYAMWNCELSGLDRVLVEKVHAIKSHPDLGSRAVEPNVGQARYIPAGRVSKLSMSCVGNQNW